MDVANGHGRPVLRMAGLSLLETMIVVAILGTVAVVGMPQLGGTLERLRIQSTVHRLSADMASARMRAISRRTQVVLCPRVDGTDRCATDGADWSAGWLLFDDPRGQRQPESGEHLLKSADPAPRGLLLWSTRPFLRYQPDGRSAHSNLSVNVCAGARLRARVVVNNLGRIRSERLPEGTPCPVR